MNAENSIYFGMNGIGYRMGTQIGVGGEGTVYAVQGTQLVAKIYKQVTPENEGKLRYMVQHPIPQVVDQYGNLILKAAWPQDLLYDGNRNFIGYVMPRIEAGVELFQIQRGSTSAAVQARFPNYSWRMNVVVARNLAASVNAVHNQGYVLGDMNCKNFLVNADGSISLLDTDSIDMTDPSTGMHYKCCVGMEDYLPPELQGRNLRNPASCFTRETDNFALAVHIFQLLMNNYHPFSGRQTVVKGSSSANPKMDRIVEGKCPYLNRYSDVTIPVGAPRLEDVLPQYMIDAFRNTFDYTAFNAVAKAQSRTTARDWLAVLKRLLEECDEPGGLLRCYRDGSHYYLRSKGCCGICKAQQPAQVTVQQPAQGTASVGDYFWGGNEFYLTEEEARRGGSIAVYARGRKEYQQLPPFPEIGSKYKNIHISKQVVFKKKLERHSDGLLQKESAANKLWELFKNSIEFLIIYIAGIAMVQVIGTVAVNVGAYGLDWLAERFFHYDLIKTISASAFDSFGDFIRLFNQLSISYPPVTIYPFQLKIVWNALEGIGSWLIFGGMWGLPVILLYWAVTDVYSEIASVRKERARRRRM